MPAIQRTVSGSHGSARVTRHLTENERGIFLWNLKAFYKKTSPTTTCFYFFNFLSALSWKRKFRAQISLFHVCILFQPLCISFFVRQKAIVEKIGDRDHRINFLVISAGSWSSGYVVMVTAYRPQCWSNCTKVLAWIWTAFCPVLLRLKPEESWKLVYIVRTTLK